MSSVTLRQLYAESESLFADRTAFAPALDWVERVLPRLPLACRYALRQEPAAILDRWLDWVADPCFLALEKAGKGEVFAWRRRWVRRWLEATRMLQQWPAVPTSAERDRIAADLVSDEIVAGCFCAAFWRYFIDYLLEDEPPTFLPGARSPHSTMSPVLPESGLSKAGQGMRSIGRQEPATSYHIPFPCILSERVVIDGSETDVLLVAFTALPLPGGSGRIFLHPEQAALRCMDETFGVCFTRAATAVQRHLVEQIAELPDFCVRLETVHADHECFLQGMMLRGASGSGALALTICGQLLGLAHQQGAIAASFAFASQSGDALDSTCAPVNGMSEKVRGCAKHGIAVCWSLQRNRRRWCFMDGGTVSMSSRRLPLPRRWRLCIHWNRIQSREPLL